MTRLSDARGNRALLDFKTYFVLSDRITFSSLQLAA
jgi:hypothetical protein